VAARCQPCFQHHLAKARELGATGEDIQEVIKLAARISEVGGQRMIDFVDVTMKEKEEKQ
jgi:alkylhydroperoxidase/carboxymuconolactone decarboxylase family protein YurZ